ncbi:MAG: hypothetical protein J6X67_06955 [Treponema sp.]|nr:hypothetical protein [Treponema sp.]
MLEENIELMLDSALCIPLNKPDIAAPIDEIVEERLSAWLSLDADVPPVVSSTVSPNASPAAPALSPPPSEPESRVVEPEAEYDVYPPEPPELPELPLLDELAEEEDALPPETPTANFSRGIVIALA